VFVNPTSTSMGSAMAMPGEVENAISARPMPTAVASSAAPGRRIRCAAVATVSVPVKAPMPCAALSRP